MPDIELRFHKDMLVLSAPIDATLARQGFNAARDCQYLNLMEPDIVQEAMRLDLMAGAACLVTPTEDITRARLAHLNMASDAPQLARSVLQATAELKPQHIIVEIGPCGLPLDASSKASLNENRGQYADAARAFDGPAFDAFLLSGFTNLVDLKCALMGVAQVSSKPVFASVVLSSAAPSSEAALKKAPLRPAKSAVDDVDQVMGNMSNQYSLSTAGFSLVDEAPAPPAPAARRTMLTPGQWPEAIDVMLEYGTAVVGFETPDFIDAAVEYARVAVAQTNLPVLAQLQVEQKPETGLPKPKGLVPLSDICEYTPDTMELAAAKLYATGVQFLRATGAATPSFTAAMAATVAGLDVRGTRG